jgi:hypothetical protein
LSVRKFSTTLGEKLDEYVVSTTIIVEKVNVVIVSKAPARVAKIFLERFVSVLKTSGIKSIMGIIPVSTKITKMANSIENIR